MTKTTPRDDLPAHWSDSVATTYVEITAENPNLDAALLASLYEACELLATADAMQARVNADGMMVSGSTGQPVAHPLISEARHARVQALAALKALGLAQSASPASRAGSALVSARYKGRTPGVRAVR